ncbi:hypothetical protein SAMN06298212_1519 [Ruaniaceae bacterium KH17]|nr:hypothetical protein SAMN06298212_1519 [Ruaniaceae bacterium KH17]
MITPLPEDVTEGTATESAGTKLSRFARRWWWVFTLAIVLIVLGVLTAAQSDDNDYLGLRNSETSGGMALGNLLEAQGVSIVEATSVTELEELAGGATTIFLLKWESLSSEERETISGLSADVVIAGNIYADLDGLTDAVLPSPFGSNTPLPAQCSDPDGAAASRLSESRGAVEAVGNGVEICFPTEDGSGLYAAWDHSGHRWRYIADTRIGTNELLAEDGNAALMLRSLGGNERLVWFRHVPTTPSLAGGASALPPWGEPALAIGALTVLAAAIWRGRRMGRVVIEPLPVVVLPGEAVRGRARLYRSAKAVGHAAESLRGGTISRLTTRLGLGRDATRETVVAAVAASTHQPIDRVGPLLYGTAPSSEADLVTLATELAELEREVHQ